jgi:glucan phosphoethanolaminetransferase (alkaline phosphatase superfamily)
MGHKLIRVVVAILGILSWCVFLFLNFLSSAFQDGTTSTAANSDDTAGAAAAVASTVLKVYSLVPLAWALLFSVIFIVLMLRQRKASPGANSKSRV